MDLALSVVIAVVTYVFSFLFLVGRGEIMAYRELKRSNCVRKILFSMRFYECPSDDYYSYKTLNGKKILFRGKVDDKFAYYHELGHLIHDNFLVDPAIASSAVFPIFLLNFPWNLLSVAVLIIVAKWYKKVEERRADIFAHEMTRLKYMPVKLEKNKVELLWHWLSWSHPPEKVRISEEYYKKDLSLIRLFLHSLL